MTTQELKIDDGTLAYSESGPADGQLILLAHGIGDSRHAFRFLTSPLVTAGYRVVATDIRGCGESSVQWPGYTRTDIAQDLVALIRHLSPSRPAIIIGHSISGGAATIAAALEPSLVAALVEIAPFTRELSMGVSDLFRTGIMRLLGAVVFGSTRLWLSYLDAAMPGTNRPDDWSVERQRIIDKLNEPGRMGVLKTMGMNPPTDAAKKLKDVKCPVLVVEGALDCDFADPKKEGEAIVADLPEGLGQLAIIEGAGHYPHFQYPEETIAAILPFLKQIKSCALPFFLLGRTIDELSSMSLACERGIMYM